MKTITILNEERLKDLYDESDESFKYKLEDIFGENFFKDITEKVESFVDACRELKISPNIPDTTYCSRKSQKSVIAFYKLTIIAMALNEGWKPDFENHKENKFYPWFKILKDNVVFTGRCHSVVNASSGESTKLACKSEKLAHYFGRQFEDLWADYLLG